MAGGSREGKPKASTHHRVQVEAQRVKDEEQRVARVTEEDLELARPAAVRAAASLNRRRVEAAEGAPGLLITLSVAMARLQMAASRWRRVADAEVRRYQEEERERERERKGKSKREVGAEGRCTWKHWGWQRKRFCRQSNGCAAVTLPLGP